MPVCVSTKTNDILTQSSIWLHVKDTGNSSEINVFALMLNHLFAATSSTGTIKLLFLMSSGVTIFSVHVCSC